ncbi:MAG: HAD family hydrolase [Burkholderiales bacterium]|nr:HAD family hydrolase [Burkholderiales bacterium]
MRPPEIDAVILDLDDTLWPIAPVIDRAEAALADWVREHAPAVAAIWDINTLRLMRASLVAERPQLRNDVLGLRRGTIAAIFAEAGAPAALAEEAFDFFRAQRQKVRFYPDALPALERLAQRYRLGVISNGFADLRTIGIDARFDTVVSAHEVGAAKPDARIFAACAERMGLAPGTMLYAGDDPGNDVIAPKAFGLHAAWINRHGRAWPDEHPLPVDDVPEFPDLNALADWLTADTSAQSRS